jgi:multidrug efflux system membrane fusion protein
MSDNDPSPTLLLLPPPRRKRKWIVIPVLLIALGGVIWWTHSHTEASTKPNKRNQTVPVALATIAKGDINIIDTGLGTVTPLANVTVRTQINGQLQEIAFQEGQIVQKGDFLAQIDPRPYQMTLEQAHCNAIKLY